MSRRKHGRKAALAGALALGTALSFGGVSSAAPGGSPGHLPGAAGRQQSRNSYLQAVNPQPTNTHTPNDGDLQDQAAQYAAERTAPGTSAPGDALVAAQQAADSMSQQGGAWQQVTDVPYQSEPANYTDPFWGNEGEGTSFVGGRTTALATTPDGAWFAGAADGGVWRSTDQGAHWTPVFNSMPTQAIGALAVDPVDGSLWAGTGEANLAVDNYAGTGVYRSTDDGNTWQVVAPGAGGISPLASRSTFRIAFDPHGDAYVATTNGLFRLASTPGAQWQEVLDPAGTTDNPPYDQQVTTVNVVPGTDGADVIAAIGWHGPGNTENNGFYQSTDGGRTFTKVSPAGDVNASDIGRTTFAYSADGSKLYAIVQSVNALATGAPSVLQGVYVSTGNKNHPASVAGRWTKIADSTTFDNSGSALASDPGYQPGVQAWYNQQLIVDPADPNHVYAGLEETFESTDGGKTWVTASPYWNYTLPCESSNTCPNTTHPDQHAIMITDGKVVIGNDGGVYSRPLSDDAMYGGWTDLNQTLATWQYYDARAGSLPGGQTGVWGGLQDNGTSVLLSGASQMAEPAGGDGFYVVVDPNNANNAVGEYTDGTMYSTTDGGHSFNPYVSPTCVGQAVVGLTPMSNCDPGARFSTPIIPDASNPDTWVTGGEYVWVTRDGWNTSCAAPSSPTSCSWQAVADTGKGNAVTALASADNGGTIYAAWTGGGGEPGPAFQVGIMTNAGGSWHQVNMTGLPQRYIAGVTVDPSNPQHAWAVFNGYTRRWVPGGGTGHVFETFNGGNTWTDITGNLPDVPGDALVFSQGQMALATDLGVYTARDSHGGHTTWSRLGSGLPNVSVNDLTQGPGGYIYAATHGRGIWRLQF